MVKLPTLIVFASSHNQFCCRPLLRTTAAMPKKKVATFTNGNANAAESNPIILNKNGSIVINVHAKPGARQNAITDISPDGVGIQVAAPPKEGEANTELVSFIAKVLGLRKGSVLLERGSKSRLKVIRLESDSLTVARVMELLTAESNNG
ncbi:UPF0235 protein C15orf40 homolog [Anneissia japonica]|uniref:UPF0235 protein C15orf40 homolog n=1 Tax=Anneissia japonica TaxID=1529436 RepID=UPI0014256F63|nr:UPF0235 protein C15orf40 homolog [Anneissia japonica]